MVKEAPEHTTILPELTEELRQKVGSDHGRIVRPAGRYFFLAGWDRVGTYYAGSTPHAVPRRHTYIEEHAVASGTTEGGLRRSLGLYLELRAMGPITSLDELNRADEIMKESKRL